MRKTKKIHSGSGMERDKFLKKMKNKLQVKTLIVTVIVVSITNLINVSHQDNQYQNDGKVTIRRKFIPEIRSYRNGPVNYTISSYNYRPDDLIDSRKTFPSSGWVQDPRNLRPNYQPPYLINYDPVINRTKDGNKAVIRTSTGVIVPLTPSQHVKSHPHHHHNNNDGTFRTHQHEDDGHHGHDHTRNSDGGGGGQFGTRKVVTTGVNRWPFTTKPPNKWIYYPTPTPRRSTTTHSQFENQLPLDFNLPVDHRHSREEEQQHHVHNERHHEMVGKGRPSVSGGNIVGGSGSRSVSEFRSSLDPFNYDLNLDSLDSNGVIREAIGHIKGGGPSNRSPRTFPSFVSSASSLGLNSNSGRDVKFERDIYERFQEICTEIRGTRCDSNDLISRSGSLLSPSTAAAPLRLLASSVPGSQSTFSSPPIAQENNSSSAYPKFDPDFL